MKLFLTFIIFLFIPVYAFVQVNDSLIIRQNKMAVFAADTIIPDSIFIHKDSTYFIRDSVNTTFETEKTDSINDSIPLSVRINRAYFKSYLLDTRDIFVAPTQWNNKQWLTFGGLSLSFSVLLRFDDDIQRFVQKNTSPQMDQISANYLEPWGSGFYSMSTMGLFYLYGSMFQKDRLKKVALLGVKTYLVTGFMVLFPKNLLGRHRPYQDNPANPYSWNGLLGGRAFVSGHTTSIWSVACIVASEYKDKPIIPIISYSIATLSGFSRIYDNDHWFTDVLGGAFFGYAMGKLIYNQNNWKLKLSPYTNGENTGVHLTYPLSGS